eukprot:2226414-Amphidinium_carterae.1
MITIRTIALTFVSEREHTLVIGMLFCDVIKAWSTLLDVHPYAICIWQQILLQGVQDGTHASESEDFRENRKGR